MATYHGIDGAECLDCGYSTTDTYTLEIMNDDTGCCPQCSGTAIRWYLGNGDRLTSD